jgi:hypothetical protein
VPDARSPDADSEICPRAGRSRAGGEARTLSEQEAELDYEKLDLSSAEWVEVAAAFADDVNADVSGRGEAARLVRRLARVFRMSVRPAEIDPRREAVRRFLSVMSARRQTDKDPVDDDLMTPLLALGFYRRQVRALGQLAAPPRAWRIRS